MPKELLNIKDFSNGIINNDTLQTTNGFADMSGLDIHSEDGIAQPNVKPLVETFVGLNENPNGFIKFDGRILAGMNDEEIWSESTANTWTLLHTNANIGDNNDITIYQNHLIFASRTTLGRSVNTTIVSGFQDTPTWASGGPFLNGGVNDEHFFKNFNNRLYISDGNVLAELDGASDPTNPANWIFTDNKFNLTEGEQIKSLEVIGGQLAIGTKAGTLFLWDGASANASAIIPAQFGGITAMINLENTLFVFAGLNGTIYRYNGADLVPAIQIPDFISNTSGTFVRKNGVKRYKNGMIFGISSNALYVFNRVKEGQAFSLTKYGNLSGGQDIKASSIDVFSLFIEPGTVIAGDTIFIGYENKIDRIANINGLYEDAFIETVEYFLRDNKGKPTKVQGVQLKFRSLISPGSPVTIKYKTDYNSTFTTLGTVSHSGFLTGSHEKILRGIGKRVDKIVFRLEDVTGKLINIKIF